MQLFFAALQQVPDSDGNRRTRFAVLRSTYPALKSTVVKSWEDWFREEIKIIYDIPIRGEIRLKHPDGVTNVIMDIVFIAMDRPEEVSKLQSLELTAAHINEAAEIPEEIFMMLKSRYNRYPAMRDGGASHPFIILDYNSPDTDHWLYELAEEVTPGKHSFYVQPPALLQVPNGKGPVVDREENCYTVNPDADNIENLHADYYTDMVEGTDADWVNVFVLNNYGAVRSGNPVYKAFSDKTHTAVKRHVPLQGVPIIIGVDVGLTPAAAFCQMTPFGQLLVIDELVTENTSIQEFANDVLWPHIKNNYAKHKFELIVDPAARNRSQNDKRSAMDVLIQAGLPTRLAKTNEPLMRREAVNFFLRKSHGDLPGFSLGPNCKVLRKGFISEYKFSKILTSGVGDRFKEKPEKNIYSHIHDGLQYACLEYAHGKMFKKKSVVNKSTHMPADRVAGY